MLFTLALIFSILTSTATSTPSVDGWYYLKTHDEMYLSSSITYNGNTNYVLLTDASLAQPVNFYGGDGSITVNMTNVIGASSQGPLYLSNDDGFSKLYKQVLLGDQKAGVYTKGFSFTKTGALKLTKTDFHGFFACSAAKGVKQLYWANQERDAVASCERVQFTREKGLQ